MKRTFVTLTAVAFALLAAGTVSAHSGSGEETVAVEPAAVDAGTSVTFAGSGLEPDSDRVLVLAGGDLVVEFGTVKTDAEGMFSKQLDIPAHLPTGTYELRAIGDETLTADVAVTALAGAEATGGGGQTANDAVVARSRTPLATATMLGLALVIVLAGLFVAWRAERVTRVIRQADRR
jgi:hypothetical protein